MIYIGIDYGIGTVDLPTYVVVNKHHGLIDVLEHGLLSDLYLEGYTGLDYRVIGEVADLQRFNEQFRN